MKHIPKVLLTILSFMLLFSVEGYSQEDNPLRQGRILAATSTGFDAGGVSLDGLEDDIFVISLSLEGGYFLSDRIVAGPLFAYEHVNFDEVSTHSFGVGAFGRYYTPINLFISAGYTLSIPEEGVNVGTIPVEVGYPIFFNDHMALEPAIQLGFGANNNDTFSYALTIGFGLYLN